MPPVRQPPLALTLLIFEDAALLEEGLDRAVLLAMHSGRDGEQQYAQNEVGALMSTSVLRKVGPGASGGGDRAVAHCAPEDRPQD